MLYLKNNQNTQKIKRPFHLSRILHLWLKFTTILLFSFHLLLKFLLAIKLTQLKCSRSDLCSISFTSMTLKFFTRLGARGDVSSPLPFLHHPIPSCFALMATPPIKAVFAKHTRHMDGSTEDPQPWFLSTFHTCTSPLGYSMVFSLLKDWPPPPSP